MCNHEKAKCIDSRPRKEGRTRRYVCEDCGERWTTMEVRVDNPQAGNHSFDAIRAKYGTLTHDQRLAIALMLEAFMGWEKHPGLGVRNGREEEVVPGLRGF